MIKKIKNKLGNKIKQLSDLVPFLNGVVRYNLVSSFKPLTPTGLMVNLTYKCNSRCVMCNIWKVKPKNEMGYKEWKNVLNSDPIFTGIDNLTISGGEAMLHEEFDKLVKLFVDSLPKLRRLTINTNGFLPDKVVSEVKKILVTCGKRGVKLSVSVSLDGVEKMHENVRNIPNAFVKVVSTLNKLKELQKESDFFVGCGSLIMRNNLKNYWEMKKWFKENKVEHSFQIVGFHDTFVDNLETQNELDFKKNDRKLLVKVLKDLGEQKSLKDFNSYYWTDLLHMYRDSKPRTTPCPFLKNEFVLDSFGDVYYCLSEKRIGNFIKENRSVSEIYFDAKNLGLRKCWQKTVCRKCNSGCNVHTAIAFDLKKYLWFTLTGKPFYGFDSIFSR